MNQIQTVYNRIRQDANAHNHRRLLVLSGSSQWCRQQASSLISDDDTACWVGDHSPPNVRTVDNKTAHQIMGQSIAQLVIDAWDGLNPNTLGQVSGALQGGGVLILLCPPLEEWPDYDDPENVFLVRESCTTAQVGSHFISRLIMLLEDDSYTVIMREQGDEAIAGITVELPDESVVTESTDPVFLPSKTADQQHAVELILSQFRRGRRPVVLTADRGRGKSSALGIAAAQLSGLDFQDILITAPNYSAAEEIFNMGHQLLPEYEFQQGLLQGNEHSIRYLEPEQALLQPGEGQVLLVDEAAAIPVPVLQKLLTKFPRIAFSSTVHGYEGTGQGFTLRFLNQLQEQAENTKKVHLHQPIRWSDNDPLESLLFDALLLNAKAANGDELLQSYQSNNRYELVKLDRDDFSEDYTTLNQLFGLLVMAHYRTTPGDLRILMDSPGLHIWMALVDGQVAGALLVTEEGPLEDKLAEAVWSGVRRPKGDLLPQTLIAQEGCKLAAPLKCGRIMRIAVHPALQKKGLGAALLDRLQAEAKSLSWDYIGTSFAANPELLSFWKKCGYSTVRFGSQRDAVSGCHAALMLSPLTAAGRAMSQHMRDRFIEQLSYRLSDDLRELEGELVCELLHNTLSPPVLSDHDYSDLQAFARHNRSYESCSLAIHKLLQAFLQTSDAAQVAEMLNEPEFLLLIRRNLQNTSWAGLEAEGQGRKSLMRQLKSVVGRLLDKY